MRSDIKLIIAENRYHFSNNNMKIDETFSFDQF